MHQEIQRGSGQALTEKWVQLAGTPCRARTNLASFLQKPGRDGASEINVRRSAGDSTKETGVSLGEL